MASSLKKVLSKVVSHTRSSSKASSKDSLNGGAHPVTNGKIEKTAKPSVEIDDTNAKGETAARKQQAKDAANGLPRPSTNSERPLSFTEQKEDRKAEREAKDDEEAKARKERMQKLHEEDPLRDNWGDLPLNMSQIRVERKYNQLRDIPNMKEGDQGIFRARIHHIRALGSKIVFLIFRHQFTTVQGVLTEEADKVSQTMVRWAEGVSRESIVLVEGVIQRPPPDQEDVHGTTIHQYEIKIAKLHVVSAPSTTLPYQVEDVSRPKEYYEREDAQFVRVGERTRLDHRVLDLRSPASHAIFRIHAGVCELFRSYLTERHFTEIHSSKLQGSSTESGAAVFKVDYFRRPAYLAQSPQLAKQMCIAADMDRVFEIGPVFRAENSNTHRHLTEFTGLDLEMAIDSHYHEVVDLLDDLFKAIFKGLQSKFRDEIETVKQYYPSDDVVILDKTPRLRFSEGIQMLKDSGWKEDDGSELSETDDLSTRAEQRLGQLVKEKYGADFYIIDKFPLEVRPFYTMPDPEDNRWSNSYDFFLRGEEILSGGQRIHVAPLLEERMREDGVDPESMQEYVDGFRWGCPPHGGGGVGLERIVMLFLKLGNIRWASLFPRDPRSFIVRGQDPTEAALVAANSLILHGPESTTIQPGKRSGDLPPLENLIAKYGDATNTSWTDPAWTVWRDKATGAAVGYIPENGFAVTFGNPLCSADQIPRVVKAYLAHLHEQNLKPIWGCVDRSTEQYLAEDLGWGAVIAVAEERINPTEVDPAESDKTVRRKIHRAEREGVKIVEVGPEMDPQVKKQLEERCQEWAANRKGTQIHLTGVRPFDDMAHRKYFYATDKDGKPCAMVVLAQLAPKHGFQIKWALEFPGAPLGAIEYILTYVIKKLGDAGVKSATFGAGAIDKFHPAENVRGFRVKALEKAYNGLSSTFNLTNKGDFRSKFGTWQDPMYICYPKGGLGMKGIDAIMTMLQKEK
ncbi:aspartyl-tRNA synthetase cytoplasmic [Trametes versicolor FP-101664 SS1]|uniref:aspartyl-tRNA synthetase cytoplasmic n=1 Tax=Trametes versicolor (strain FP-101664) TaxID=717944 RepID=UPI0004621DC8|nr:aspartyl-tRNA synthetase cytoplasmic [Trametes versicolor FP-101664 SS1]EIW62843.1 aspartyl-tRNA synthetase cytoplasmic [Trametes versicolor FP-101664 SS1]